MSVADSPQQSHIDLDAVAAAQGDQTPEQVTPDPDVSLFDRLGGTYGIAGGWTLWLTGCTTT